MQTNKGKVSFKDLKKQFKSNAYYNSPNNYGKEGEDHINISIQSETKLGKLLDPAYLKTINYKHVGKFNSVLSLWYWVRSNDLDDNFRRLTGAKLKMYAEANGVFGNYVPNFKAIIAKATWTKIKGYPAILREIKDLKPEVKLLSYHIVKSSNLRICTNYAAMIIEITEELFKAVREDREPNFALFVDKPNLAGLDFLEGVLSKIIPKEKIEEMKLQAARDVSEEEDYELAEGEKAPDQAEQTTVSDVDQEQNQQVEAA